MAPLEQAEFIQQNPQRYQISGDVDFTTVPDLQRRALGIFRSLRGETNNSVYIDWAQVDRCNSAALGLIFEMANNARANDITLQIENLPDTLLTIAKAYGVEDEIRDIGK